MDYKFIRIFFYLLVGIYFSSCSNNETKNPEINWDERLKTKVEPFVVEYFEFTVDPDSALVLYFNRDINENEDAFISIHTIIESLHFFAKPLIPIQTVNRKFVLKLPIPDSLSNRKQFDDLRNKGLMMQLFREYWNSPDSIDQIDFSTTMDYELPTYRFLKGKFHVWKQDFLLFSNEENSQENHNNPWRKVLLNSYKGVFYNDDLKQGKWQWFYSNGSLLANGDFRNDTLISNLLIYNFKGELIDSIIVED